MREPLSVYGKVLHFVIPIQDGTRDTTPQLEEHGKVLSASSRIMPNIVAHKNAEAKDQLT